MPMLLERTVADFKVSFPTEYEKHGSLLRGDMGAALLATRLLPPSSFADLVHRRAAANNELPIRELMWGMPGSMLAAIHMAEMTHERRWRSQFEVQAAPPGCWPIWRRRRRGHCGRKTFMASATAGPGPFTVLMAMPSRYCMAGIG
jgi:hypothetical protein